MKKFKLKYVKFVYFPKPNRGNDWHLTPNHNLEFGNKHTDKINKYQYNGNNISYICSEFLEGDIRNYDKKAKFTISEAHILVLKYCESELKKAKKSIKQQEKYGEQDSHYAYHVKITNRNLEFYTNQVKILRQKVKEIKKSPEYMWEQILK